MIGGRVQQVVDRDGYRFVEVLDYLSSGDRVWRWVDPSVNIAEGDTLWWQSFKGFLTRHGEFVERHIGECRPSDGPAALRTTGASDD